MPHHSKIFMCLFYSNIKATDLSCPFCLLSQKLRTDADHQQYETECWKKDLLLLCTVSKNSTTTCLNCLAAAMCDDIMVSVQLKIQIVSSIVRCLSLIVSFLILSKAWAHDASLPLDMTVPKLPFCHCGYFSKLETQLSLRCFFFPIRISRNCSSEVESIWICKAHRLTACIVS